MRDGPGKMLLRGGLWAGGGRVVAAVAVFLGNVLLARLVSPENYGVYFLAVGIVTLAATLGVAGLDQTVVRLVAEAVARGRYRRLVGVVRRALLLACGGAVAACLLFWALRPWLIETLRAPALMGAGLLLVLWIGGSVLQIVLAETFRGLSDIRTATLFAGIRSSGVLLSVLFLFGLAALGVVGRTDLSSIVALAAAVTWILAGAAGITLAVALPGLRRRLAAAPRESSREVVGSAAILGIALPLLGASLMVAARTQGDVLMLGALASSEEVAVYVAAVRFMALLAAPLLVINSVLAPLIADLHTRGRRRALETAVRVSSTIAGLPAVAVLVVLVLGGRWALGAAFGDFYRAGYPVLLILMTGQLSNVLAGPNALVLIMTGSQRLVTVGMTLSAFWVLGVGGLLAASWGALGMAAAAASGLLLQNVFMLVCVRRRQRLWTHVLFSRRRFSEGIALLFGSAPKPR